MSFGIRVFDTILDGRRIRHTSKRNAADFWCAFCQSANWNFSYERVHSLVDVNFFFKKKIKEDVIIFSGHGSDRRGWNLSNGECIKGKTDKLSDFPTKNHNKIIIFSACLIGNNEKLLISMQNLFNSKMIFAYKQIMYDSYCFIHESILLSLIEEKCRKKQDFVESDFNNFLSNTEFMKNMNRRNVKNHPMVMLNNNNKIIQQKVCK